MQTTELYFEYIIIGLETLFGIFLLFFVAIGEEILDIANYCFSNLPTSIMLIAISYVLGLITDRIADKVFERLKFRIKRQYPTKAKTSLMIWKEYNQQAYASFTLSRIRVLRSSAINFSVVGSLGMYISLEKYKNIMLFGIIAMLTIYFSLSSYIGHKNLLINYYQKTKALERDYKHNKKKLKRGVK